MIGSGRWGGGDDFLRNLGRGLEEGFRSGGWGRERIGGFLGNEAGNEAEDGVENGEEADEEPIESAEKGAENEAQEI